MRQMLGPRGLRKSLSGPSPPGRQRVCTGTSDRLQRKPPRTWEPGGSQHGGVYAPTELRLDVLTCGLTPPSGTRVSTHGELRPPTFKQSEAGAAGARGASWLQVQVAYPSESAPSLGS